MDYKGEILEFCTTLGLDTVGFTRFRVFNELILLFEHNKKRNYQNEFEEQDVEKRINPFLLMPGGKTIVSIAFPYLFEESAGVESGFSKYTMGEDYHRVVTTYLRKVCDFIEKMGGKALLLVDNNPLPERYIAYLSGIGFIGKNNMLITRKYGSFVFLGEILTDLDILSDESVFGEEAIEKLIRYDECGECSLCFKECPTKAIHQNRKNSNICLSYITQKKHLEDVWFYQFKGRIFGCDSCQGRCPYNKNIAYSNLEEFRPKDFMLVGDINELLNIDNAIFREKYSKTSCGWRGKNVLQRNALLNNMEDIKSIDPSSIKSEYVREYYYRLLKLSENNRDT